MNVIHTIGYLGTKKAYLNIDEDDAIARYCKENGIDGDDISVDTIRFEVEFGCYSVWEDEELHQDFERKDGQIRLAPNLKGGYSLYVVMEKEPNDTDLVWEPDGLVVVGVSPPNKPKELPTISSDDIVKLLNGNEFKILFDNDNPVLNGDGSLLLEFL